MDAQRRMDKNMSIISSPVDDLPPTTAPRASGFSSSRPSFPESSSEVQTKKLGSRLVRMRRQPNRYHP